METTDNKGRRLVQFYAGGRVKKKKKGGKVAAAPANPMDQRMTTGVVARMPKQRRGLPTVAAPMPGALGPIR